MRTSLLANRSLLVFAMTCAAHFGIAQGTFLSLDYPYKEIQQMLYNKGAVQILFEQENSQISASYNGAITSFLFRDGVLYNIDEARSFEAIREAEGAFALSLQYLVDQGITPVNFEQQTTERHVAGLAGNKVYHLILQSNEIGGYNVVLSCKNVSLAPVSSLEGLDFLGFGEKESQED